MFLKGGKGAAADSKPPILAPDGAMKPLPENEKNMGSGGHLEARVFKPNLEDARLQN